MVWRGGGRLEVPLLASDQAQHSIRLPIAALGAWTSAACVAGALAAWGLLSLVRSGDAAQDYLLGGAAALVGVFAGLTVMAMMGMTGRMMPTLVVMGGITGRMLVSIGLLGVALFVARPAVAPFVVTFGAASLGVIVAETWVLVRFFRGWAAGGASGITRHEAAIGGLSRPEGG